MPHRLFHLYLWQKSDHPKTFPTHSHLCLKEDVLQFLFAVSSRGMFSEALARSRAFSFPSCLGSAYNCVEMIQIDEEYEDEAATFWWIQVLQSWDLLSQAVLVCLTSEGIVAARRMWPATIALEMCLPQWVDIWVDLFFDFLCRLSHNRALLRLS